MLIPQLLSRGFPAAVLTAVVSVRISSWRSISLLSLAPRPRSEAAGATPGEAGVVYPSPLGGFDSADRSVVPDGGDLATPMIPCVAVGPADAPVVESEVDPAIPVAAALMCDGDPDEGPPCENALVIPAPAIPSDVASDYSGSGDSRRC